MPLPERLVLPTHLGSHPIQIEGSSSSKKGAAPHLTVANNSLVGALLQLASLVRHADDIFCDISDECSQIFERSKKVGEKIGILQETVSKLDARNVVIPVGELRSFSCIREHHETDYGIDCDLFTKKTRPQCIKDQYQLTDVSPSQAMHGVHSCRKDGMNSSRLFKFWPMAIKEPKKTSPDLTLYRKFQSRNTFEKPYKKLKQRPRSVHEDIFTSEQKKKEKEAMKESKSKAESSALVPIDTSTFQRSQSLTRSRRIPSSEEKEKRKARRKTVSGVADHVLEEIQQFEKRKKHVRDHPRDYSFDELDLEDALHKDDEMLKYLDEIEAKMEEREQEEKALRSGKFMKFISCRRSKSLPRCLKLHTIKLEKKPRSYEPDHEGSCLSIASGNSASSRLSRSTKRSSIISNKIKSFVRSSSAGGGTERQEKPRPKSLDLETALQESEYQNSLARSKMPSMPDGMLSPNRSKFGPGSYYDQEYESNTIPRRSKRQSELPWENLPKDWTSSVKLREISKRCSSKERQSSSGHWSGYSSSNRQSLDSDVVAKMEEKASSSTSLGQDSGRFSPTMEDQRSRTETDTTGFFGGDESSTVTGDTESNSDSWLKDLAKRAASRDDISSNDAEALNSLTRLTKKNIMELDKLMSPTRRRPIRYIDDDESVYSVDQEGFYTSFHTDSGLRRSSGTLVDDDEFSLAKDSLTFDSSDSEKYAGLKKGNGTKILSKVSPPTPPVRTSSKSKKKDSLGSSSSDSSSPSDSDSIMKLKQKTEISPAKIPSMCLISSDDDSKLSSCDSKTISSQDSTYDITADSSVFSISMLDGESTFKNDLTDSFDCLSDITLMGADYTEECNTLPRTPRTHTEKTRDYNKSWPRVKKDHLDTPSGILKSRDQSPNGSKPHKSLNFSPVVDLCNPGMKDTLQILLPDSPPSAVKNVKDKNGNSVEYKLSIPIRDEGESEELPLKYQPTITVKPGGKNSTKNGNKGDNLSAVERLGVNMNANKLNAPGHDQGSKDVPQSTSNSGTTGDGSHDSFMGSLLSLISGESFSISDIDSQHRRGSGASSPNLSNIDFPMITTPAGSTESLVDLDNSGIGSNVQTGQNFAISNTVETIAISTNHSSFVPVSSLDKTVSSFSSDKPLKTFSNLPIHSPISASTPYNYKDNNQNKNTGASLATSLCNGSNISQNRKNLNGGAHVNINHTAEIDTQPSLKDHNYDHISPHDSYTQLPGNNSLSHTFQHIPVSKSFPSSISAYSTTENSESDQDTLGRRRGRQSRRSEPVKPVYQEPAQQGSIQDNTVAARNSSYRVAMKESKSFPLLKSNVQNILANGNPVESPKLQQSSHGRKARRSWQSDDQNPVWLPNPSQSQGSHPYGFPVSQEELDPEDFNRSDSYRYAVRNTHGIVAPSTSQDAQNNRNTSYRVAMKDLLDPVSSDLRGGRLASAALSGRDIRRMGITDVDQVKGVAGGTPFSRSRSSSSASSKQDGSQSSLAQGLLNKVKDITKNQAFGSKNRSNMFSSQSSAQLGTTSQNKMVRGYSSESQIKASSKRNSSKDNVSHISNSSIRQEPVSENSATQQVVRRKRVQRSGDADPITVVMENTSAKSNKNRYSTSSTYICFDPIMEDGLDPSAYFGDPASDLDFADDISGDQSKFNVIQSYETTSPNASLTRKARKSMQYPNNQSTAYVEGSSSIV